MPPIIVGEHPLAKSRDEKIRRVGLVFLADRNLVKENAVVTGERTHGLAFDSFIAYLNQERASLGKPSVTESERNSIASNSVDIILDKNILIRPDPCRMDLALKADTVLQEIAPKPKIKYLGALDENVRLAIKQQGECYRISPLPRTTQEQINEILGSILSINTKVRYYYNRWAGVRLLTYDEFSKLENLEIGERGACLEEILGYSKMKNSKGNPAVGFFMAKGFCRENFEKTFDFDILKERFYDAVQPEFRRDDYADPVWRKAMVESLLKKTPQEVIPEEVHLGLCPEFYMHIEWLPGAKIEQGRLVTFDPIFNQNDEEARAVCDEKVKGFILNFLMEYSQIEYVNIGRVIESLCKRVKMPGRRGVYIAAIKIPEKNEEIVKVIRLQKYGVKEYIEEGKHEPAREAANYRQWVKDRYFGCERLGMKVLPMRTGEVAERYNGGIILTGYFERSYIDGIATDKVHPSKYKNKGYSLALAKLLGEYAVLNMVVGRVDLAGRVLFDDGDEVIVEDENRLPKEIVLAAVTGSFRDYDCTEKLCPSLERFAAEYAGPVNRRVNVVPDAKAFADCYIESFVKRFKQLQEEYRNNGNAFDTLFSGRIHDPNGSIDYRWEQMLRRLENTDVERLGEEIRKNIKLSG